MTCIFNKKKFIALEVNSYYYETNDEEPSKHDAQLAHFHSLQRLQKIATKANGYVAWTSDVSFEYPHTHPDKIANEGEFSAYLLIPFEFAYQMADNFIQWKAFLAFIGTAKEEILVLRDCIARLLTMIKPKQLERLIDRGFMLEEVHDEHIDFDRITRITSVGSLKERITFKILDKTFYGSVSLTEDDLVDVELKDSDFKATTDLEALINAMSERTKLPMTLN